MKVAKRSNRFQRATVVIAQLQKDSRNLSKCLRLILPKHPEFERYCELLEKLGDTSEEKLRKKELSKIETEKLISLEKTVASTGARLCLIRNCLSNLDLSRATLPWVKL